jgi:hypothetical protein
MTDQPKYPHPHFFTALAKRVTASPDIPSERKELFEIGARSLLESDCTRAIKSLEFLPKQIHDDLRAAALKDVGDERRLDQLFERTVGASPTVPPGATRH